jgi:ubiquinol-cytochrome c reductase cytochrome b subunit
VLIVLGPGLAFWITRRWAISLQRADRERLLHGRESGVIVRSPDGGYSEKREQISTYEAYALTARDRDTVLDEPTDTDENGVARPHRRRERLRTALSRFYFADVVPKPTRAELDAAHSGHSSDAAELEPRPDRTVPATRPQ